MGDRLFWKQSEIDKVNDLLKQVKHITDQFDWFNPENPNFVTSENRLKTAVDEAVKWAGIISHVGKNIVNDT